jgi:hypothetical protein
MLPEYPETKQTARKGVTSTFISQRPTRLIFPNRKPMTLLASLKKAAPKQLPLQSSSPPQTARKACATSLYTFKQQLEVISTLKKTNTSSYISANNSTLVVPRRQTARKTTSNVSSQSDRQLAHISAVRRGDNVPAVGCTAYTACSDPSALSSPDLSEFQSKYGTETQVYFIDSSTS